MRRLLALSTALVVLLIGGQTIRAEGIRDAAGWGRPDLGCHRVYFTPPGWGSPIEIEVCP